jgi:hypothetical protein
MKSRVAAESMSSTARWSRSTTRPVRHTTSCCSPVRPGALRKYRRTHPPGPWIYTGGDCWEFQYAPGDEFPVFETDHGVFGLAMCSEAYMPEVTRALALRGAEVLFLPAGIDKLRLWASWRNLIWSRAIENLAVTITTQNIFDSSQKGLAMVATPEEIIFESTRAGVTEKLNLAINSRNSLVHAGHFWSADAAQQVIEYETMLLLGRGILLRLAGLPVDIERAMNA